MQILLTGATGFIGSHTAAAIAAAGHELRILARTPDKARRILADRGVHVDDVAPGDMADEQAVRKALDGCDGVVHTAALMYGGSEVLDANLAGVRHLLGIGHELGLDPLVYLSSVAAIFPPRGDMFRVDDEVGTFETMYGRSKALGEQMARDLQAAGAPVVSIYPAGVYGPDDPVPGEATKGFRDRLRWGWPLTTGGTSSVDVRDLAAIIAATLTPGRGPRRYMAGGHFVTWADEADLCERLIGRPVKRIRLSPKGVVRAGRFVDILRKLFPIDYPLTREAAEFVTRFVPCDSQATIDDLGIDFRPLEETLTDAIRWQVRAGHLKPKHAGRLASEP